MAIFDFTGIVADQASRFDRAGNPARRITIANFAFIEPDQAANNQIPVYLYIIEGNFNQFGICAGITKQTDGLLLGIIDR